MTPVPNPKASTPAPRWLAGPEPRPTRFGEPPLYREGLHELSPRTYAWMVPNGSWGEANMGLVDCGGESVLIDTGWDLAHTREMLYHSAPVLDVAPISTIVNTHADGDHCWGNQLFEGRPIVATQACIDQMHHLRPGTLRLLQRASGLLSHLPVGDVDGLGRYMGAMLRPYDFGGVRITVPNQGFRGQRELKVGQVAFMLHEVGPGHTDGDMIVHVPDRDVVYAGDILFVGVTPVMWAGPVEQLVRGLRKLLDLQAGVIVPGHGPLATRADVQAVIDYWDCVTPLLERAGQAGVPADEAAARVLADAAFQCHPFAQWTCAERLVTSAYTLYRHRGWPVPSLPGALGQLDLMRRQARVAARMP